MSSSMELLLKRRAVRLYEKKDIPPDILDEILNTAKYAPSALGRQARHFTVIQNRELMSKIVEATERHGGKFVPGHVPFYGAPVVVVLSAPESFLYNREDAACAVMTLMLAAKADGLDSCYICSVLPGLNDGEVERTLKLPAGYAPFGSVCLGYAKGELPKPKPRRTDDVTYLR